MRQGDDEDGAATAAMADLEDVCGDLFGLPPPAEIARRERAFDARRPGRRDGADAGRTARIIAFPPRPGAEDDGEDQGSEPGQA